MKRKIVDKKEVETVTLSSSSESDSSSDDKSELEMIPVSVDTKTSTTIVDTKTPTEEFVDENVILLPNSEENVLLILTDKKSIYFKGKLSVEVLSGTLVNVFFLLLTFLKLNLFYDPITLFAAYLDQKWLQ